MSRLGRMKLFGWLGILMAILAVAEMVTGNFIMAAFAFGAAWACLWRMTEAKHNG